MNLPTVCVIVLNWNGRKDTLACLASLRQVDYPALEVVVVDNHSTDDSVAAIRAAYPMTKLIVTDANLGYVGGNNLGLNYAGGVGATYALLLNNDTEVAPDFLGRLVAAAEADSQIGIAGPTVYYHAQPNVIWSAGGEIDRLRGRTRMVGIGEVDRKQWGERPRGVDFVTGCALLVKLSVVVHIGLLDQRFFAYYEDIEWCVRAARAGFKVVHVPLASVWHKITPEAREASPQVHYYMTRNQLLFLKLTNAGYRAWVYTLLGDYGRTLLSWTIKPRWRLKAPQRAAMLQAIRDSLRGTWGRVDIKV